MSTNKIARKKLEKLYGKECFIEKLHLRVDKEPRRYKSKGQMKRMKQLTYHHILERYKGGKATVENGAIVSGLAHAYMHSLPRHEEEVINNMLREYKECKVVFVDDLDLGVQIRHTELVAPCRKKEKYDRAKMKRETMELEEESELEL